MTTSGNRAIVLGASMTGLLAARVLSDYYPSVTVIERDFLPEEPAHRRGIPHGRQPHILVARAPQILDELFPGCMQELVDSGCLAWKDGDLSKWCVTFGGHRLASTGTIPQPEELVNYACTRPFLEWHVRRRLRELPNVTVLEGHNAGQLTTTPDRSRVTGVRVFDRGDNSAVVLDAELVVDATGRGSRALLLLEELGYGRPAEDEVFIHLAYASMPVRIEAGTIDKTSFTVLPAPGATRGVVMFECENNTWMVGVCAMFGEAVPDQRDELLEFARGGVPAPALAAARAAIPLDRVAQHLVPSNRWRRYDKMSRTPGGFLVMGDAICSFNPVYGQGITVAAIEALILRDCLARGERGLPGRFFKRSAKAVKVAWQTAVGSDLAMPQAKGARPLSVRMINAWIDRVLAAAETDPAVVQQFLQVVGMTQPPSRLLHPSFAYRVVRACCRERFTRRRRNPASCQRESERRLGR